MEQPSSERMFIITMPFTQASMNVFPPHRNISRGDAASEKRLSASLLYLSTTHSSLHPPSSRFSLSSLCKVSFVCFNLKHIHGCSFFGGGVPAKNMYMVSFYRVLVSARVSCCGKLGDWSQHLYSFVVLKAKSKVPAGLMVWVWMSSGGIIT